MLVQSTEGASPCTFEASGDVVQELQWVNPKRNQKKSPNQDAVMETAN